MSEHSPRHETAHTPDALSEQGERTTNKPERQPETTAEAEPSLNEIRQEVAEQAHSKTEIAAAKDEKPKPPAPGFVTHSLKVQARTQLLKRVREHLATPDKWFSQAIHQPVVDSLSELGSKTIARPSGLLSGGICAFLGSSIFLYIAKHDGYHYNFLLWAILFVAGFVIGLLLEALVALLVRLRS